MYRIVGLSGSLRRASTNTGLLRCAAACCEREPLQGRARLQLVDIHEVPLFNADVEEQGAPDSVKRLVAAIAEADGLLLACPEYNYSMAPALKNALDWASRVPDNSALAGKPAAMLGAGGLMGTSRAQYHLRQTCVRLDLVPINKPEGFFNAFTGGFAENGDVLDSEIALQVEKVLGGLVRAMERGGIVRR